MNLPFPLPPLRRAHRSFPKCPSSAGGLVLIALGAVLLVPSPSVRAQSLPSSLSGSSSNSSSSSPPQPGGSSIEKFSDVLESGGEWLVDVLKPNGEEVTVDSPQWNSLESPRHSVLSFLEAMRFVRQGHEQAWPRARRVLPPPAHGDEPRAEQESESEGETKRESGSEAKRESRNDEVPEAQRRRQAEDLFEVLARWPEIAPSDLPGPREVEQRTMSRYELFPYGLEHEWIWQALDEPPQGTLVLRRGAEGNWRFTRETLAGATELRQSLAPLPPHYEKHQEGQLFLSVLQPTWKRTSPAAWLGLAATLAAAVFCGIVIVTAVRRLARRADRTGKELKASTIRGFALPLALLCGTVLLSGGLLLVHFGPTLSTYRWHAIQVLLVVACGWLTLELVDSLAYGLQKLMGPSEQANDSYQTMAVVILRRILRAVVLILFALFILQNLFGWNVTALLAGLGLAGLALSLAAQGSARNLFGGLSILFNRPFLVGDWVRFKDYFGTVEDVGMQATQIRLLSGEVIVIPNSQFIDTEVRNYSLRKYLRREMNIAVPYDTPPEKIDQAIDVLRDVLTDDRLAEEGHFDLEERAPLISFSDFGPHYLNLKVYYWYMIEQGQTLQRHSERGWFSFLEHCSLVNREILSAFNEAGVEFAFPTSTVHLTDDDTRGLRVEAQVEEAACEAS